MTTPYVTGTVSVTAGSAIVTGAGTGWQTAGLVAGVFGLDSANGNPIPVLSVDGDTQITLAKPWRGTTASGQAYWITYDTTAGQQTVSLMQKVVDYIARLDKPALAALASLIPAADKLPYFGPGGAGALADFNAAARALLAGGVLPNAQLPERIRSLTNLKNDANLGLENGYYAITGDGQNLPVAGGAAWLIHAHFWNNDQFGVQNAYELFNQTASWRRYRVNGAFTPWRSAAQVTVGTVSNNSGFPSGAIIERGSNANGEYVRFADGTQICWRLIGTGTPEISAGGSYSLGNLAYPAAFSVTPSKTISYDGTWCITAIAATEGGNSTSTGTVQISNRDSVTHTFSGNVSIVAIGRWY